MTTSPSERKLLRLLLWAAVFCVVGIESTLSFLTILPAVWLDPRV